MILLLYNKINTKKINFFDYVLLLFLILVCGLRENVGTDYNLYKFYYSNINQNSRFELGFKDMIIFSNNLGLSYNTFLLIVSAITMCLFYFLIKKYSRKPASSIFYFVVLGYYAYSFNIIRQMLAISISLFGIKYIKEKKFIRYLVVILIASIFHSTALIMIPVYFLLKLKNNIKNNVIIIFLCGIMPFLYTKIFTFIVTNFKQYNSYATINDFTFTKPGSGTYVIGFINFILFLIFLINKNKLKRIDEMNDNYIKLFSYSLIFTGLSFVNSVAVRGGYYLSIYLIFLLPNLANILFKEEHRKLEILIMLLFVIYYFVHLISFNQMIPYNSIL
ncbi:EpsG family protein [Clostridium baratii]|uniref:EpsG family protein n=1 Tax=Clostridium baratii TaxID=1561 RepID=UPI0030D60E7B